MKYHPIMSNLNGDHAPKTPMAAIAGKWPGDETDQQVEEALASLQPIKIPKNLDAWYENHCGPVVLVVQPRRGIGGQSSLVHMLQQPSALFFESVDAATDYHNRFPERFREAQKVSCYPVCLPPAERAVERESHEND